MTKFLIFGPPGSGKGTTAKLFAKEIAYNHISSGDLFRREIAAGTALGREVQDHIAKGELVDDATTSELVLHQLHDKDNFILDGYPRTVKQAVTLLSSHQIKGIIQVVLSDDKIVKRIAQRRVCPRDGSSYHLTFSPPKTPNKCDHCGATLLQRADDSESTVRDRLAKYHATTEPALQWLTSQGIAILQIPGDFDLRTDKERIMQQLRSWKTIVESQ